MTWRPTGVRVAAAALALGVLAPAPAMAVDPPAGDRRERPITTRARLEAATPRSPNPFVSFLPEDVEPDYRYWSAKVRFDSWDRAAGRQHASPQGVVVESEDNDSIATADPLPGLVAGGGPLQISGETDSSPEVFPPVSAAESGVCSNDTFATATHLTLVPGARLRVEAAIGDCSSGAADIDIYSVYLGPGDVLTVDVDANGPDTYAYIAAEPPYGLLDFSFGDPYGSPGDPDPYATASIPTYGEYWAVIASSAGTGSYDVLIGQSSGLDIFSVELEAGDVIGVSSSIVAELSILGPDGVDRFGSYLALNDLYPSGSPLPTTATGSEVSDVARESGTHYVRLRTVERFPTAYTLEAEVFRPGPEGGAPQTIFVDFDGATINADALFDAGPQYSDVTLSPLSSFLSGWDLGAGQLDALISEILATIEENLDDLAAVQPAFSYQLLNSRDDADPFGQPGVSRLIIGGTQDQIGLQTIGISSAIDPGNFGLEDTAVVLLDRLSGPGSSQSSLNRFAVAAGSSKVELVGRGVGNIASHETGHFLGAWHTETDNSQRVLVDSGGDLADIVGTGNETFGDFDDVDVDFAEDVYSAGSGLRGLEDQAARAAFALLGPDVVFTDGFETGGVGGWSSWSP